MSKLDINVGDEFPLDEGRGGGPRGRHHRHHHHGHHHSHGHHHHRGHRRRGGTGRVAALLVIAGLAALILEHRLPAEAAWGLIGLGFALVIARAALHWRFHRRIARLHAQSPAS